MSHCECECIYECRTLLGCHSTRMYLSADMQYVEAQCSTGTVAQATVKALHAFSF